VRNLMPNHFFDFGAQISSCMPAELGHEKQISNQGLFLLGCVAVQSYACRCTDPTPLVSRPPVARRLSECRGSLVGPESPSAKCRMPTPQSPQSFPICGVSHGINHLGGIVCRMPLPLALHPHNAQNPQTRANKRRKLTRTPVFVNCPEYALDSASAVTFGSS
jgi:hypothetical protein